MLNIGDKLRKLREENKLSLRKTADLIGVDVAALSKMERGERKLSKEIVRKLARIYKHDHNELLVLYLSEKVVYELGKEDLALKALKVAEEQILYLTHKQSDRKSIVNSLKKYFAEDGRVKKAWMFGSFSKNEADHKSDIDIMIKVSGSSSFSLFDLADLQFQIQKIIPQKVDLVMYGAVKPEMMKNIKPDMKLIYERQ